ncbi:serine protease [Photobacterium sp. SDRW27]|uniref:S1 family peptidase n=1 Tax=Photobacterium obscurum TaxID=2829490 RepID=UPI002242EBB8|nr:serine protease [Photobacterium obscurum]MCW8329331.1 serine protease [Photobacterium obscurum]
MENNKLILSTLFLSLSLSHSAIADEVSESVQSKVLNGESAASLANNLLPWQAAMLSEPNIFGQVISGCGAVVIADHWAVTAAHCVDADMLGDTLVAGTTYIPQGQANTVDAKYQFKIINKIKHENYNPGLSQNLTAGDADHDIALLEIEGSLTSVAKPIKVATPAEQAKADLEFANTWSATAYSAGNLIGSGWGNSTPDYEQPNELQVVKLGGIPISSCNSTDIMTVDSNFICADSNNPDIKKDVCAGDSGGPLIWQNPEMVNEDDFGLRVVGVTSNGPSCEYKDKGYEAAQYNGLYTELAAYYDWIEDKTGLDLDASPTSKFDSDPFKLAKEDKTVKKSSGSSGGGSVPLGAIALMSLAAFIRRKK